MIDLIDNRIAESGLNIIGQDLKKTLEQRYQNTLYDNQIDIFQAIQDVNNHFIMILEARGGGKTYGVALSIHHLCSMIPKLQVCVFAPKYGQSKRMIKEIYNIDAHIKKIDQHASSTTHIVFKSGAEIFADSANEKANIEGGHYDIIVIDESHRCSDVAISERIMPMMSRKHRQMIKIGVALYKNNFKESFEDEQYVKIIHDYLHCPILKLAGVITYKGVEYPRNVVDLMPWEAKLRIFGEMAHKLAKQGKITMLDFITQYELQWMETVNNFLTKKQQINLMGTHKEIEAYDDVGTNVFAIDTAAGSLREDAENLDMTTLAVWNIFRGKYNKIFAWEIQDTPLEQYKPILAILKRYRPSYGLIDYSNCGTVFPEMLRNDGIRCEGIMYKMTDQESHKPYKYAMLDYFSSLVDLEMIKYPQIFDKETGKIICSETMYKSYMEWTVLQKKQTEKTLQIGAPAGKHDDHCAADYMAIWAAKRINNLIRTQSGASDFVFHSSQGGLMSG